MTTIRFAPDATTSDRARLIEVSSKYVDGRDYYSRPFRVLTSDGTSHQATEGAHFVGAGNALRWQTVENLEAPTGGYVSSVQATTTIVIPLSEIVEVSF